MVTKRRFIRLDEVSEKTPLTKGDVLDLVENGDLTFCATVEASPMAAFNTKQNSVCALFGYRGVVRLSQSVSRNFVLKEKTQYVDRVAILQPNKISDWGTIESYFGEVKHSRFEIYNNLLPKPDYTFIALAKVEMGQTLGQMGKNLLAELGKGKAKEGSAIHGLEPDHNHYLQSAYLPIQPQMLRLDLEAIERLIDCHGSETDKRPLHLADSTESLPVSQPIFTHPIQQAIANVLRFSEASNSRQIWHLIKADVERDQKHFDTEAVIFEMTNDDLSYFGLGDTTKTITYRRFQNLLSEVRKKLHG
jgi:hypothetical protein